MARPKKRKYLKYTNKLSEYVLERIESGKNLLEICKEYNATLADGEPTLKANSIHKWKRDHPEFKEQYDIAYESNIQYQCEYIEWLSAQPPADTGDYKRDGLLLNQRKNEIDTIKFKLAKLNANRFKQEVKVTHEGAPQIVVQSYATPDLSVQADNKDLDKEELH
jgi:hypothetical protein